MKDCRYRALSDLPLALPEVSPRLGFPLRAEHLPVAEVLVQTQGQAWAGGVVPYSVGRKTRVGPMECMQVSHPGHLSEAGLSWRDLWSGADIRIRHREGRFKDSVNTRFQMESSPDYSLLPGW